MRDPLALASSGRTAEADALATQLSRSTDAEDQRLALQTWRALGESEAWSIGAESAEFVIRSLEDPPLARDAVQTATACRLAEAWPAVARAIASGTASVAHLRAVEQIPSLELADAMSRSWDILVDISDMWRGVAAVEACARLPVRSATEARQWGRRLRTILLDSTRPAAVRAAALESAWVWGVRGLAAVVREWSDDPSAELAEAAARVNAAMRERRRWQVRRRTAASARSR